MKKINQNKNTVNKYLMIGVLFLCVCLAGCDSGISGQIEKCVQATVASNGPFKNDHEKLEMESIARLMCLKSASGKE